MPTSEPRSGDGYWRLVQPVWRAVSIYHGPVVFLQQFQRLQPEVSHLFAAHWCQSEIRNGGLHQFFMNSTGVLAPEATAAFRVIGLVDWAGILDEAMQEFELPYPRDTAKRHAMLGIIPAGRDREDWDPFYKLDERFYAWLNAEEGDRWCRAADQYAARFGG